jgi:hypothetical protein
MHLPLILPSNCTFRVGNEAREWQHGKAWIFDESVGHEARNDSNQLRVQIVRQGVAPLCGADETIVWSLALRELQPPTSTHEISQSFRSRHGQGLLASVTTVEFPQQTR